MNLEELRKQNALEEEEGQEETTETEETEEETEETEETEEETGEEGQEETPLWMQDADDEPADQTGGDKVPLSALMKQKSKVKERDAELETLRAENEQLKQGSVANQPALKRPRAIDFDDDDQYEDALEKYDVQRDQLRVQQSQAQQQTNQRAQARDDAFDGFIERSDAVATKHKIEPTVFHEALESVREVVEAAFPDLGDNAYPEFISRLKPGAETTLFQIGKSKIQKAKLAELLRNDNTAFDAIWHIATLTERNSGVKTKTSKAPKPATTLKGDTAAVPAKERAWRKKYDQAGGPGSQAAFNIKMEAKAAGVKL